MRFLGPEIWGEEKISRCINANPIPFGIPFLDDALMGILPNDLILVGAKTGCGKTELATNLALNAAKAGKRCAFFALEADKWEIHRRMKYKAMQRIYWQDFHGTGADFVFPRYRQWLSSGFDRRLNLIEDAAAKEITDQVGDRLEIVYKGDRFTAQDFASQMAEMSCETDLFILDHLHYFDLLGSHENEGLKQAVQAVRAAAIFNNKPVVLLAHLRKTDRKSLKTLPDLEDFHGHSDIVKIATVVLLMAPVPAERVPGNMSHFPTYFHVAKARTAAEVTAFVGIHGYDPSKHRYTNAYLLERAQVFEDPCSVPFEERPAWAKGAQIPSVERGRGGRNGA